MWRLVFTFRVAAVPQKRNSNILKEQKYNYCSVAATTKSGATTTAVKRTAQIRRSITATTSSTQQQPVSTKNREATTAPQHRIHIKRDPIAVRTMMPSLRLFDTRLE